MRSVSIWKHRFEIILVLASMKQYYVYANFIGWHDNHLRTNLIIFFPHSFSLRVL